MRFVVRQLFFLPVLLSVALVGCGTKEEKLPDTVPFTGTVTLDGKPLAGAAVGFRPLDEGNQVMVAGGMTDSDGKYELSIGTATTKQPKKGALPGKYRVRVSLLKKRDGTPIDPTKPAAVAGQESLPDRYSNFKDSKLEVTVPAGGGSKDFELKSK